MAETKNNGNGGNSGTGDRYTRWHETIYNVMFIVACIGIVVLGFTAGYVFFRTISTPDLTDDVMERIELRDRRLLDEDMDLLGDTKAWGRLSAEEQGEVIRQILLTESRLLSQNNDYLSDLRQESNNNINKTNGWLAFWIAVLGMGSIVLTVLQEIRTNRNFNREKEKLRADWKTFRAGLKNESDRHSADWDRMRREMDSLKTRMILQIHINDLRISLENSLIGDSIERDRHMLEAWRKGWDIFDRMVGQYRSGAVASDAGNLPAGGRCAEMPDGITPDFREMCCQALGMLYDMWTRMYLRWPETEYNGRFFEFGDELRGAIRNLRNASLNETGTMAARLDELSRQARGRLN